MRFRMLAAGVALALLASADAAAQHQHGAPPPTTPADSAKPEMMGPGPLGVSHAREGSGTSWQPDLSPMYMVHASRGDWMLMLHGNSFLQYIREGSERGDGQFGSIHWLMGMAQRELAGGELWLRTMASLERLTVGPCGYPDLLATGEFCEGEPLHDRQHPHDAIMELAAAYARELTGDVAFQIYGGLAGEPALGPNSFPHRVAALPNPVAPIGHHWLDATHITFGVATAGVYGRRWKLEGSVFNGREPDEDRWDLDLARMDSYSGRVWLAPSERWTLQLSAGHLNEAELGEDGGREDVDRITASVAYYLPLGRGRGVAATAAWGRNTEEHGSTDAFLVETAVELLAGTKLFARAEAVEKTAHDLVVPLPDEQSFRVGKLGLGVARRLGTWAGLEPGVGAMLNLSLVGEELEPFYGATAAGGFAVFASLRPAPMAMQAPAPSAADGHEHAHPGR